MPQPNKKTYISPQEYLVQEENAEYRSEYYNGEIFAMAGGTSNHNTITLNVGSELRQRLKGNTCRVYMVDMRLLVEKNELYTYPDVFVVCDKPKFVENRKDTITNPIVIIEVLSESTKNYDRTAKFELYRDIDTLKDYILIEQDRVYIEYFHKTENDKWILQILKNIEEILIIQSIKCEIKISEIYDKVEFVAS
jgi:Uma2 family endonuclease